MFLRALLLYFFLFASLQGCKDEPQKIRIGHTNPVAPFSTLFDGHQEGIEFHQYGSGVDVLKELESGNLNYGIVGSTPIVLGMHKYKNLYLHGALMLFRKELKLLIQKGVIVEPNYANLKVGIPYGSTVHQQYLSISNQEKLSMQPIYLKPQEIEEAWSNGTINSAIIWEPYYSNILHSGAKEVTFKGTEKNFPSFLGFIGGELNLKAKEFLEKAFVLNSKKESEEILKSLAMRFKTNEKKIKDLLKQYHYPANNEGLRDQLTKECYNIAEFLYSIKHITKVKDVESKVKLYETQK